MLIAYNKIKDMKTIYKIIGIVIIAIVINGFSSMKQQTETELIIGTWIEESSTFQDRIIIQNNGIYQEYDENAISDTYNWEITEKQTPSGLTLSYLILTNTQDANDVYEYEINALNNEILVLVYQRPDLGPGEPTTYIKQ